MGLLEPMDCGKVAGTCLGKTNGRYVSFSGACLCSVTSGGEDGPLPGGGRTGPFVGGVRALLLGRAGRAEGASYVCFVSAAFSS